MKVTTYIDVDGGLTVGQLTRILCHIDNDALVTVFSTTTDAIRIDHPVEEDDQ